MSPNTGIVAAIVIVALAPVVYHHAWCVTCLSFVALFLAAFGIVLFALDLWWVMTDDSHERVEIQGCTVTDRGGRLFAICVAAPALVFCAIVLYHRWCSDCLSYVALFMLVFGIGLFAYETWWILVKGSHGPTSLGVSDSIHSMGSPLDNCEFGAG